MMLTTQYMEEADQLADRIAIIDWGRIVTEGTPAELKRRVGDPTLALTLASIDDREKASSALSSQGDLLPGDGPVIEIRLPGGSSQVAAVVRTLDQERIDVEGLELHMPTLDDVFHDATGRRLEGAQSDVPTEEEKQPGRR